MPLIVDFWAPWCGPCRTMAPIFDKAAKELEPRARFAKVNVDEEPAIAARFGIRGIPTLIAFEKGKVAKQHAGLVDLNFLRGLAEGPLAEAVQQFAASPTTVGQPSIILVRSMTDPDRSAAATATKVAVKLAKMDPLSSLGLAASLAKV